jgi:hypothetical protein
VDIQQQLIRLVTLANWVLLFIIGAVAMAASSFDFALGVICGGLIVTVNFHLLARTLRGALTPPYLSSHNLVLAKYYLRFIASGVIIFILISCRVVDPIGLVIGLSVVVASIIFATVFEFTKLIIKEAV